MPDCSTSWRDRPLERPNDDERILAALVALVSHQWDVAGNDDYDTSLTTINYVYAFGLGGGWQVASGPFITYDWHAVIGPGVELQTDHRPGGEKSICSVIYRHQFEQKTPDSIFAEWI